MIRVLGNRLVDVENFINFLINNINKPYWYVEPGNDKNNEIFICNLPDEGDHIKITIDGIVNSWISASSEDIKYHSIFLYMDDTCLSCKICPETTDPLHKLTIAVRKKIEELKTSFCLEFISKYTQSQLSGSLK